MLHSTAGQKVTNVSEIVFLDSWLIFFFTYINGWFVYMLHVKTCLGGFKEQQKFYLIQDF